MDRRARVNELLGTYHPSNQSSNVPTTSSYSSLRGTSRAGDYLNPGPVAERRLRTGFYNYIFAIDSPKISQTQVLKGDRATFPWEMIQVLHIRLVTAQDLRQDIIPRTRITRNDVHASALTTTTTRHLPTPRQGVLA